MRRLVLFTLAAMLAATAAWAMNTKDVVFMHRSGIADSLIVQKIRYSGATFHLDGGDIRDLQDAGVSDAVISAMLQTEGRDLAPAFDPEWGPHPYVSYVGPYPAWYYAPYWGPWRPGVFVDLGFRFGHGHGRFRR